MDNYLEEFGKIFIKEVRDRTIDVFDRKTQGFLKIGLMVKEELMWNISNFDSVPVNSEDYSGVGRTVNDSRQRVYLFQQRILNEHTVVIGHKELLNLFGDIRTIYEAIFVATIDGCQSEISIFDGDIISIQGNIEDFL